MCTEGLNVFFAGFSDQPFPNLPQYAFFSTYFGGFAPGVAPGSDLGALRPGLYLEGKWELVSKPGPIAHDGC